MPPATAQLPHSYLPAPQLESRYREATPSCPPAAASLAPSCRTIAAQLPSNCCLITPSYAKRLLGCHSVALGDRPGAPSYRPAIAQLPKLPGGCPQIPPGYRPAAAQLAQSCPQLHSSELPANPQRPPSCTPASPPVAPSDSQTTARCRQASLWLPKCYTLLFHRSPQLL